MRRRTIVVTVAAAALGLVYLLTPVTASALTKASWPSTAYGAVFVQTDNSAGNQVVSYDRSVDGQLTLAGTYDTGGLGASLDGSVVDHLASQGSLTFDPQSSSLFAVNAGSNTVSVFSVRGSVLTLRQVISSGGDFPVSVSVRGNLVFVLNALNGGSVQGFFSLGGWLVALPWSNRSLDLGPESGSTQFVETPGQVTFSPNGAQLIVTTKANGSDIDVFGVGPFGFLSFSPVVNSEPGTVPFGVSFDSSGRLVVANAGNDTLATYSLGANGTVTPVDSVATNQAATCWVAAAQGFFFASNAGSASVTGFGETALNGQLSFLADTTTDPGTVDAAPSSDGRYLYVQTGGNGVVDEFRVVPNGSLVEIGSVTVASAVGGEGIAVS
jgi:hypothetical protein